MIPFEAKATYDLAAEMGVHQGGLAVQAFLGAGQGFSVSTAVPLIERVLVLARHCELPTTPGLVESHIREIQRARELMAGRRFAQMAMEINRRFADELGECLVLRVPSAKQASVAHDGLAWGEVLGVFPAAEYDAVEATKCYVMGRSTATVFHAIRVLEVGLACLKRVANLHCDPMWHRILEGVRDGLKENARRRNTLKSWQGQRKKRQPVGSRPPRPPWSQSKETSLCQMVDALEAFKDAYRNRTSHDPEVKYSPGQARDILDSVVKFMSRMAEN